MNTQSGPLLSDETLFLDCLDLTLPALESVRRAAADRRWADARHEMACVMRASADPGTYFDIPFEPAENDILLHGESDETAVERILRHTLVSVGVPCAYGAGVPVDWTANPTENGYKEWTWQLNRHHELKLLAHQYRLTGRDELAYETASLFVSWVRQAIFPGEVAGYETKCWRTIECGIRQNTTWPYTYLTFVHHPAFTDDVLIDWLKSIWEHADRLSRHHMQGNWLIMEMNGLAQITMLYPWFRSTSAWRAQAFRSLDEELDRQIYPDGFQFELTTNYHYTVVRNYQRFIEAGRALGCEIPQSILDKLEHAATFEYLLMMPDGTTPDLNDGRRIPVREVFRTRQSMFPDNPVYRWIVDGDSSKAPPAGMQLLPWSGMLIGRTGWSKDDAWMFFDAAPFGRAHQHEDKLNVLFYAHNRFLLSEGGNYAYDSSPMRAYVLSTMSHNTAMADGYGQNRMANYAWHPEDIRRRSGLKAVQTKYWIIGEGEYNEGYGPDASIQVRHVRKVCFRCSKTPFLIVIDRFYADEPHGLDLLWHIDSSQLSSHDRCQYFAHVDAAWSAGTRTVFTGCETPSWQGWLATGTRQGEYRASPCLQVHNDACELRVVTVIVPHDENIKCLDAVKAGTDTKDSECDIYWHDGSVLRFTEADPDSCFSEKQP